MMVGALLFGAMVGATAQRLVDWAALTSGDHCNATAACISSAQVGAGMAFTQVQCGCRQNGESVDETTTVCAVSDSAPDTMRFDSSLTVRRTGPRSVIVGIAEPTPPTGWINLDRCNQYGTPIHEIVRTRNLIAERGRVEERFGYARTWP